MNSGSASKQSEKEITGNSNFNFGADKKNTVTVTLTRVDGKVLNSGTHYVQCFIIKNGNQCVAMSEPFVVRIS